MPNDVCIFVYNSCSGIRRRVSFVGADLWMDFFDFIFCYFNSMFCLLAAYLSACGGSGSRQVLKKREKNWPQIVDVDAVSIGWEIGQVLLPRA